MSKYCRYLLLCWLLALQKERTQPALHSSSIGFRDNGHRAAERVGGCSHLVTQPAVVTSQVNEPMAGLLCDGSCDGVCVCVCVCN